MKKQIRQLSPDGSTVQITIADERWYIKTASDSDGNITSVTEYPSVTWICDHYPKGIGFYKWLAEKGWNEAESIKEAAGDKGHKVHEAISSLLLGNTIKLDDKLLNADTGEMDDMKLEEYDAIMSFANWHKATKPKMLANEVTVFNELDRYAGTADFICEIDGVRWLIDFKTGQYVWPSYEIQLSAYKAALPKELYPDKLAILQIGYKRNKNGYKFTEMEDQYELFNAAHQIWSKECSTVTMFKKDYPTSLSLS